MIHKLLSLHNLARHEAGLAVLTIDMRLVAAAQKHTQWMKETGMLSHYEGSVGPGDRMRNERYYWMLAGENIAMGYPDAQAVFNGWMNSEGHKANIMNPQYENVGFGQAGKYWTADFGTLSNQFGSTKVHCSGPLTAPTTEQGGV